MAREIKFRGKKLLENEFVYGYLTSCHEIRVFITDEWEGQYEEFIVDPATVGYFTGLKDKNGIDIYEGDIIKATHYNFSYPDTIKTQLVYFDNACFCVKSIGNEVINPIQEDRNNVPLFWLQAPSSIEVIGNIHESPELLNQ